MAAETSPGGGRLGEQLEPSALIGEKYRVVKVLGKGDRKCTYLARDIRFADRLVAVSVPRQEAVVEDPDSIKREANLLSRVKPHSHIVALHEYEGEGSAQYLVFEYLSRGTLAKFIERTYSERDVVSVELVVRYGRELANALSQIHQAGVVHRDVTPDNIWLDHRSKVKLGDFDSAVILDQPVGCRPVVTGTFASPEDLPGGDIDQRSDLYSLGRVLLLLSLGEMPADPVTVLRKRRADFPPALQGLIVKLIEPCPNDRPDSAAEVLTQLNQIRDLIRSRRIYSPSEGSDAELDLIVGTRFPHPVAYRWRMTQVALSGEASGDTYDSVLDTAEVLLCYAAVLGLIMARAAGLPIRALENVREKLGAGHHGMSLGDWVSIIDEICTGRAFGRLAADAPLRQIRALLPDEEAHEARRRLTKRRNDRAHLRRIDKVDLAAEIAEAEHDLRILMHRAACLASLPLIRVEATQWDEFRSVWTVKYRELTGDNPVVPVKTIEVPDHQMEQGSLYVLDEGGAPHLMRPFLVGADCPICRHWSTFVVDTVPAGGPIYRSLEHGHTLALPELAGPLSRVGLLPND